MVKFNNLKEQFDLINKVDLSNRLANLFLSSSYINGPDVQIFEKNFAKYIGSDFAVGVSNGTDAIELCVKAIKKPGNTLYIIPNNTFIATYLGIRSGDPLGTIETIDCDNYYQINIEHLIDTLVLERHKYDNCVIVGVHLYGHCCDVQSIINLCERFDCTFMEDASQSHGTMTQLGKTGSIGTVSAFSLYPGKNLGAVGDAGIITTNSQDIKERLEKLRNFGSITKYKYELDSGVNHRLDSIQAIFLDEKLKYLDQWNARRQEIAKIYNESLNTVITPKQADYCPYQIYHIYAIRSNKRDELELYLNSKDIETGIHYPQTLEQINILNILKKSTRSNRYSQELLSLPMHPFISDSDAYDICEIVNEYTD